MSDTQRPSNTQIIRSQVPLFTTVQICLILSWPKILRGCELAGRGWLSGHIETVRWREGLSVDDQCVLQMPCAAMWKPRLPSSVAVLRRVKARIPRRRQRHRHPRRHPREEVGVGIGVVECELKSIRCADRRPKRLESLSILNSMFMMTLSKAGKVTVDMAKRNGLQPI